MASSGSFNTSGYDGRYLKFSWSIKSQDSATNKTVISWTLKGAGNAGAEWYMAGNFKVVIDGDTVYSSSNRIQLYNGTTVASGTYTLTHNSNGTKSFTASAEAGIYYTAVNCTGSGSFTLNAIPRYATVSQGYMNVTETSAVIVWSSDSVIDYIWYSTNNGSTWTGVNVADGKTGQYTISGLSPQTAYQIKTRVRRKDSQLTTDSSAMKVTTYAYPYANSMPNFTIGDKLTIGVYNPLGRNFKITVIGADGSEYTPGPSYSGTSVSGFNATAYVNFWYASIPNAKSGTYRVEVTEQYTGQGITTTKTGGKYSCKESDCKPSINAVTYQDTNSTVTNITGNNQQIVRNKSTVRYTATGVAANKSASISSVKVAVNGNTYNMTLSGTTATGGNAAIDSSSNVTATVTVTDSRGYTATKSVTVTMLDWVLPSAIINMYRQDNYYTTSYITVDAIYSSVDNKNTCTIRYTVTRSGASSPTISGTLQDNVQTTFEADNNYDWNVQVTLTDKFGTTTYNLVLTRGMPIIYFDRLKSSVGVNCFPNDDLSLEVNGINIDQTPQEITPTEQAAMGVTLRAYSCVRSGKVVFFQVEFALSDTLADWTPILTGLPGAYGVSAIDVATTWGATYVQPCRVSVSTGGTVQVRYGGAGNFRLTMTYITSA